MAGHSKWANIKHKKAAADAKRGKVFTMHAKMITIAARSGGDPDMNPTLRAAIDRAKLDNVPNANIDRAIKKGTGEDKDGADYEELTYEAFGPEGSVFMIDVITDNRNRSLTNIRTLLTKSGGNMGSAGSVAWKFDKKSFFLVDLGDRDSEEAQLELIECGADDIRPEGDKQLVVYGAPESFSEIQDQLKAAGYKIEEDGLTWLAKDEMEVASESPLAEKILKLMDKLDDDDDVKDVSSNVNFID